MQFREASCAVARLLSEFPFGGLFRGLIWFQCARWQLNQRLFYGDTIIPDQANMLGIDHWQNGNCTGMPNDGALLGLSIGKRLRHFLNAEAIGHEQRFWFGIHASPAVITKLIIHGIRYATLPLFGGVDKIRAECLRPDFFPVVPSSDQSNMRQYASWSIMLFRWGHVHVRLHMFFLLFAAFTLFLSWSEGEQVKNATWYAAGAIGILLVSVLLHELGHYFTAQHFGGDGPLLVLWPLGGLCPLQPPLDPRQELLMHLAGPLINLGLCAIAGIVVSAQIGSEWLGLLHPLAPKNLFAGPVPLLVAKGTFWMNWILFLVNLLPAFPFDGGRALRSAIVAMNPDISVRRAAFLVAGLAKLTAVVFLVLAVLWWSDESNRLVPVWFSLVLLALFLYFSAKQEEERVEEGDSEEELFGYDFSQGYTSLERTGPASQENISPFRRWLEERRQARLQRQIQIEAEEERRVDEILSRLHEQGMSGISAEDRALLKRVSQRLRHRQSKDG